MEVYVVHDRGVKIFNTPEKAIDYVMRNFSGRYNIIQGTLVKDYESTELVKLLLKNKFFSIDINNNFQQSFTAVSVEDVL